jgi:hypothetical protein
VGNRAIGTKQVASISRPINIVKIKRVKLKSYGGGVYDLRQCRPHARNNNYHFFLVAKVTVINQKIGWVSMIH